MSPAIDLVAVCECAEISVFHLPHECKNDGDQTCTKCGRHCCPDCIYADGLCVTCSSKEKSA